jgi:hypothetical protein
VGKPDRRTALLVLGLMLAIALTFLFGYRAGHQARLIRLQNQPIRPWMSITFIAHLHHVAPEILYQAIGVEPRPKDHRPLRRIAHEQKRPVEEMIRQLNTAIAQASGTPEPKKP